jgi:hypothetical protein
LGENINIIHKNTEALLDAREQVGPQVNAEEMTYMFTSRHQTTGQNHYIKAANKPYENVAMLKYLGTRVTNQNRIHKEIKTGLNSGNACTMQFRIFCLPVCCAKL